MNNPDCVCHEYYEKKIPFLATENPFIIEEKKISDITVDASRSKSNEVTKVSGFSIGKQPNISESPIKVGDSMIDTAAMISRINKFSDLTVEEKTLEVQYYPENPGYDLIEGFGKVNFGHELSDDQIKALDDSLQEHERFLDQLKIKLEQKGAETLRNQKSANTN